MAKSLYFRLSLFLPLIVLAVIPPFGWVFLAFAGLPYVCFALLLFALTRASSERRIQFLSLVAPILFFPVVCAYWAIMFGLPSSVREAAEAGIVLLAYVLVVGYLFVGLVHLGAMLMYNDKTSNQARHGDR